MEMKENGYRFLGLIVDLDDDTKGFKNRPRNLRRRLINLYYISDIYKQSR
jgi:hypothetical protein